MTNDSTKNGVPIPISSNELNVLDIVYRYRLMWCDEDKAHELIALAKQAIFKVNCHEERRRECQKHNIKSHILFGGAQPDFTLRDIYTTKWWLQSHTQRAEQAFVNKYNMITGLVRAYIPENNTRFADVFDRSWKIISNATLVQEKINVRSFNSYQMMFAEHQENGKQILLISDVHLQKHFGELQKQVISDWKPDAASIELGLKVWWHHDNNPIFEDTEDSKKLSIIEDACSQATAACAIFGLRCNSEFAKVAAILGMSAMHFAKGVAAEACKKSIRHANWVNMMQLLPLFNEIGTSRNTSINLFLADWDWYFHMYGCYALLEKLVRFDDRFSPFMDRQMKHVKLGGAMFHGYTDASTLSLDSEFLELMNQNSDIISSIRSDLMFMSLMTLTEPSRKNQKVVGVYGMAHVMDIRKRFQGNDVDFFMD